MNITVDRAVIEQALDALEQWNTPLYKRGNIITALRTALEQPEQEPVAKYSDIVSDGGMDPRNKYDTATPQRKPLTQDLQAPLTLNGVALYPRQQPLTDEEIQKMRHLIDWTAEWTYITFARAIEHAHGIKE